MQNPLNLAGQRVLVTGAASGIGRAIALTASQMSASVVAVDRDEAGLASVLTELSGDGHVAHKCDLRDVASIPAWMSGLAAEGGPFAGMVHAAGISCISPLRLLGPEAYRDVMAVNCEAGLSLARTFQRAKVNSGPQSSIVFIASVMGMVGSPGAVGYSMSKAAVIGMSRSMAVELAPRMIRVNCIAPGFVRTPMLDALSGMWNAEQAKQLEAEHPLGLGEPQDVANAAIFLLAGTSRWITGTVITVDGGYTAH